MKYLLWPSNIVTNQCITGEQRSRAYRLQCLVRIERSKFNFKLALIFRNEGNIIACLVLLISDQNKIGSIS